LEADHRLYHNLQKVICTTNYARWSIFCLIIQGKLLKNKLLLCLIALIPFGFNGHMCHTTRVSIAVDIILTAFTIHQFSFRGVLNHLVTGTCLVTWAQAIYFCTNISQNTWCSTWCASCIPFNILKCNIHLRLAELAYNPFLPSCNAWSHGYLQIIFVGSQLWD